METKKLFLYALKKSVPVMLGYVFLGVAFGILLQRSGFGWPWAALISATVYAGSMQFALVPLLSAAAPLSTVALMTLMVNSRHLFYGLSFVDAFREMGRKRPYMIFSLSDETYSVLCSCAGEPEAACRGRLACFWIALLHQCYWVIGSIAGAVAGEMLAFDSTGIDFSMTALFAVILTDQIRGGGRTARRAAATGAILALAFLLILGPDRFLLPALACTALSLAVAGQFSRGGEAS